MKYYKQILEAINRGIQLALDDYEDGPEELTPIRKNIIKSNPFMYVNWVVDQINTITLHNGINIDSSVKRQIKKYYKILRDFCNQYNIKYKVKDRYQLKELIRHIVALNPKENLNWIDTSEITTMFNLFDDFFLWQFSGDISEWDVHNVTNMYRMFNRCEKFNCDISNWDVSRVESMDAMFSQCKKFNLPIGKWNVSNATNMSYMFEGCSEFNLDLSNWNVHNVKEMQWMFCRCKKLNLDFSMWDVSNVEKNSGFYFDTEFSKYPEKCPHFNLSKTLGNA